MRCSRHGLRPLSSSETALRVVVSIAIATAATIATAAAVASGADVANVTVGDPVGDARCFAKCYRQQIHTEKPKVRTYYHIVLYAYTCTLIYIPNILTLSYTVTYVLVFPELQLNAHGTLVFGEFSSYEISWSWIVQIEDTDRVKGYCEYWAMPQYACLIHVYEKSCVINGILNRKRTIKRERRY